MHLSTPYIDCENNANFHQMSVSGVIFPMLSVSIKKCWEIVQKILRASCKEIRITGYSGY